MAASAAPDGYPSALWITLPPLLLLSAYYARKWYRARRLRLYGIGKGAPGFQTNVRRVRVTPEIAARLRRGEHVSPDEIAAASAAADAVDAGAGAGAGPVSSLPARPIEERAPDGKTEKVVNEWLPESITGPKKRGKGKKR